MTLEDVISKEDLVKVSENQVALYDRLGELEKKLLEAKKTPEEIAQEEAKKPLTEEKLQKLLEEKEKKEELKKAQEKEFEKLADIAAQKFNIIEANVKTFCEEKGIPFKESVFNRMSTENIKLGNSEMKTNNTPFDWSKFEERVKADLLDIYADTETKKEVKVGSKSLTGVQDEVSLDLGGGKGVDRVAELEQMLAGHFRTIKGNPRSGDRELSYEELTSLDREVNHGRNQLRKGQYR